MLQNSNSCLLTKKKTKQQKQNTWNSILIFKLDGTFDVCSHLQASTGITVNLLYLYETDSRVFVIIHDKSTDKRNVGWNRRTNPSR